MSESCMGRLAHGKGSKHRYYKIENGTHVDPYFDRYRQEPEPGYARPVLPCYWAAFGEFEEWVERKNAPPGNTTVPHPTPQGTIEDADSGSIYEEAADTVPRWLMDPNRRDRLDRTRPSRAWWSGRGGLVGAAAAGRAP